jgi:two-component system response regulator
MLQNLCRRAYIFWVMNEESRLAQATSDEGATMAASAVAAPSLTVLLVEDDEADVALVEDYFDQHSLPGTLQRVTDGVEALQYLRGEEPFAGSPQPDIILLDLNMPRMDGRELLNIIKASGSRWTSIPVIVFTTSSASEDISRSYHAHANAFVIKAIGYDDFQQALSKIHDFFGNVASLDGSHGAS